jgi:hypothetical protein
MGSRKTRAHTPVDHRVGGPLLTLRAGPTEWTAVELVHVRSGRADAAVSASETLIELLGKETDVRAAAVLVSRHKRRVATFVWLSGHEAYAKLRNAWDEYHLEREHREAVEKRDLSLCRITAVAGDPEIRPGSRTVLAIERLHQSASKVVELLNVIEKLRPAGFVGAAVLGADDGLYSYLTHWWEHKDSLAAFRKSDAAQHVVGAVGHTGDPYELYELIRTFGPMTKTT